MLTHSKKAAISALAIAATLILASCGNSGNSGSSSAGAANKADVATAKEMIAPYTGQPSKFPITKPLATKPTGKRIAYLDCGTPICGLFYTVTKPAMEALGMSLTSIKAGLQADTVQAAVDTVVQDNINPIEKVERSTLIVASTIHNRSTVDLIQPEHVGRVERFSPMLF